MEHIELRIWEDILDRRHKHENQRAAVHPFSLGVSYVKETDLLGLVDSEREAHVLVVDTGSEDWVSQLDASLFGNLREAFTRLDSNDAVSVYDFNFNGLHRVR